MPTRLNKRTLKVIIGFVGFIVVSGALIIFALYYFSHPIWRGALSATITSVSCDQKTPSMACRINFTLTNKTGTEFITDLNGIDGPGFDESHISQVRVLLSNGTEMAVFADTPTIEGDPTLKPNQTQEYTGQVSIPAGQKISRVKIFDANLAP